MENNTIQLVNGVNVSQLLGTIQAVKENPSIALFKFKATNQWIKGGHSQTQIQAFYGANQEDQSRPQPFILEGDEPPILLGQNNGPNAVEAILHALASCLAVGIVYNAAAMGIEVNSLNFSLEGTLDLHTFLGLDKEKRAGYKQINIDIQAETNTNEENFANLINHVKNTSPVLDIITNPVPVSISF